jgi:hypothetical protein
MVAHRDDAGRIFCGTADDSKCRWLYYELPSVYDQRDAIMGGDG